MAKESPSSLLEEWQRLEFAGLVVQFESWFSEIRNTTIWSHTSVSRKLIPWQRCREAFMDPSWREIANLTGVYLFGSDADGIIYVGMTGTSFRKRFSRYISESETGFPKSQFRIADAYSVEIKMRGIAGIAQEVVDWYGTAYPSSNDLRLRHAVGLAERDLQNIWITLLESRAMSCDEIKTVEKELICISKVWNRQNGFGPLLND